MALRHGILPLVYKTIKKLSSSSSLNAQRLTLNAEILTELKAHYMSISQRNMLMSAELIRIMKLLEEHDIEALAFKGPALSQMAYGDITLRQYSDLDILVDEKDAYEAGRIMSKNGFSPVNSMKILTNSICLKIDKDFSFISNSTKTLVEMHWRLVPKELNTYFNFYQLLQDKKSITINQKEIYTLSNEHLLIYLCIHGSKHAWERIEWVCDIDRLICSCNLNWNIIILYTNSKSDQRALLLGVMISHQFFKTPLPDTIMDMLDKKPDLKNLYTDILHFFNYNSLNNNELQRIYLIQSFVANIFHERKNKILTFIIQSFKISRRDCQTFVLPYHLRFLYIVLRPFRLIYTRLFGK